MKIAMQVQDMVPKNRAKFQRNRTSGLGSTDRSLFFRAKIAYKVRFKFDSAASGRRITIIFCMNEEECR